MCRVRVLAGGTPVIIELEEKDEFRLTPEKLLETNHTEDKGAGSAVPEQSNGRDHGTATIWRRSRR